MKYSAIYEYENKFDKPIEWVWERISDTNRWNEICGSDIYKSKEVIQKDKSILRFCQGCLAKADLGNIEFKWSERFGEWNKPHYLRQQRNFTYPIIESILVEIYLEPTSTGCIVHTKFSYMGDSFHGWLGYKLGYHKKISNARNTAAKNLILVNDRATAGKNLSRWKKPIYSKKQLKRVDQIVEKINSSNYAHQLGRKIADYAMHSLAIDVARIRPMELAIKWNLPDHVVIEACIQAMNLGLLDMRWDVLCPQCQVSKAQSTGLHDIPKRVHCSTCNIEFGLNFDKNVEITFLPAKWLRLVGEATFCMLSAQLTPQIDVQLRLNPMEEVVLEHPLKPGVYRCRAFEDQCMMEFTIAPEDIEFPVIQLTQDSLIILPEKHPMLTLINKSVWTRYFLIEDLGYRDLALTGQKVTAMHVFRQLCPEQLIKAGDNIGISQISILFTDLKDSTALYYQVGEANAYRIVREHFSFLSEIIYKNHGTIVKTIGDSVMAVFYDPEDSVRACLDIRKKLDAFNQQNNTYIAIKIGIHQQSCIAVTLNNIMDYFGAGVNITARLHGYSDGNDIIVSDELMKNPGVNALIADHKKYKCSEKAKGAPDPINFYLVIPSKKD